MNIEELKSIHLQLINELQKEVEILNKRIEKAKTELSNVKTSEDLEKFRKENDLEEGFEHIELF